jgi:hypothetical protein
VDENNGKGVMTFIEDAGSNPAQQIVALMKHKHYNNHTDSLR